MESRILITVGATFLVAICYLLIGVVGNPALPALMLAAGVPLGLLPYGLWRLGGKESSSGWDLWLPGTAAFTGMVLGSTASLALFRDKAAPPLVELSLMGILIGVLSSGAVILWKRRQRSAKCPCCQQPLGKRTYFCPRGPRATGHTVCHSCWRPDNYRCKDCDWLRTPLLALQDDEWWTERLDKRSRAGQCSVCGKGASESDLRPCQQCTRPMCINCWDMENGRCVKCSWVIEGLPKSLADWFEMHEEIHEEKMDRGKHYRGKH